jgi:ATP-dependent DNA helicase RecG
MKVLGSVNHFSRAISKVKKELADNGNPEAVFDYFEGLCPKGLSG